MRSSWPLFRAARGYGGILRRAVRGLGRTNLAPTHLPSWRGRKLYLGLRGVCSGSVSWGGSGNRVGGRSGVAGVGVGSIGVDSTGTTSSS